MLSFFHTPAARFISLIIVPLARAISTKITTGPKNHIMSKLLFAILLCSSLASIAQTPVWKAARDRSSVSFSVTHLVISKVEGSFREFDGEISTPKPDFTDASIRFQVDAFSIHTGDDKRDSHLKSGDFLAAEQYPKITFQSTSFRRITEGRYLLEGDLTIRDVTRRLKFNVTYGGIATEGKKQTATFKATTYINRFDYNLQWDKLTEAGGMVVDKMVSIMIKLEFVKQ